MLEQHSEQFGPLGTDRYLGRFGRQIFCGFLTLIRGHPFRDDKFGCANNSRNGKHPNIQSALSLQTQDKVRDEKAEQKAKTDFRFKLAFLYGYGGQLLFYSTLPPLNAHVTMLGHSNNAPSPQDDSDTGLQVDSNSWLGYKPARFSRDNISIFTFLGVEAIVK